MVFQRYITELPTAGEIVIVRTARGTTAPVWNASWASALDEEYREFLRQTPEFERNLVRSGIHLLKFWFSSAARSSAAVSRSERSTR